MARAYIDEIIAINRRHDMHGVIPEDVYEGAVREVARAATQLREAKDPQEGRRGR